MKIVIIIFVCLLIFTGCDATYDLDIDASIKEDVTAVEKDIQKKIQ